MKISVVIPIKNQANILLGNLKEKVLPYFDACGLEYEVVVSPNGFNPEQRKILEEGMAELEGKVRFLPFCEEAGKGRGVKLGIEAATGDYLLIMDADCATDLSAFDAIKPDLGNFDAFAANRDLPESKINKRPWLRQLGHTVSISLVRRRFGLKHVGDTQCGFKCYRGAVAKEMAKRQTIMGFAYDVEHCYFLELNGFRIKEIPVIWFNDEEGTTVSIANSRKFSADLKKIKRNKDNYILTEEERKALC
ncbi:MAG: glycosyltransferase [Bacilli bacterium]|nr:glycosyltransferase [Bacilli bacterium]